MEKDRVEKRPKYIFHSFKGWDPRDYPSQVFNAVSELKDQHGLDEYQVDALTQGVAVYLQNGMNIEDKFAETRKELAKLHGETKQYLPGEKEYRAIFSEERIKDGDFVRSLVDMAGAKALEIYGPMKEQEKQARQIAFSKAAKPTIMKGDEITQRMGRIGGNDPHVWLDDGSHRRGLGSQQNRE